jgi:hypothetical protein
VNWNVPELQFGILQDAEQLVERLAFCVAAQQDPALQARLRSLAGIDAGEALLVQPLACEAWLKLTVGESVQVLRAPAPGCRQLSLTAIASQDAEFHRELSAALLRFSVRNQALDMIAPIFDTRKALSGSQIAQLLAWAPMIEHAAYKYFTHAGMLLDERRCMILGKSHLSKREREAGVLEYWTILHAMGHMLTIASTVGARAWLADMASSFTWMTWTPSFALLRERTLWLMAAAVKSAVAFGDSVAGYYLDKLSNANHPIKSFDALVGLAALGLDQPRIADQLAGEVDRIKQFVLRKPLASGARVARFHDEALRVLREPEHFERRFLATGWNRGRWRARSDDTRLDALRCDPTDMLNTKDTIGFVVLPMICGPNLRTTTLWRGMPA